MLSNIKLFENKSHAFSSDCLDEIYSQLFYLQINCVKFLFDTLSHDVAQMKELISTLRTFVEVCPELYNSMCLENSYVFQCCGRVLRLIRDAVNMNEKSKYCRIIIAALLSLRLISYLPHGTSIVSDLLSYVASGGLQNLKINFNDFHEAFIKQPYLAHLLVNILNPVAPMKDLFTSCLNRTMEIYEHNPESCWKLLHLVGNCPPVTEFSVDSVKSIVSFTRDKKCLRKHLIMEIGLRQSSEQLYQFSLSFRDQIIRDIIHQQSHVPEQIVDIYEKLTFCLFVNGLPSLHDDPDSIYHIGWLILVTNSRSIVALLLNVIKILIESRLLDSLTSLLKSPNMSEFNQLLLVNLWHPNLADEKTMQILLDLCYGNKHTEIQSNYIEQLCIKIRTRWDTLRRFNERLSTIRKEQDTPTQLILDLTTMGNTSHLELVTGLLDPTGLDSKVVVDLLDRSGSIYVNSSMDTATSNMPPLETETIEENCDKNIFYCSVSIRKLWECLVLFSPIETRQMIFKYLHQRSIMMDTDVITPEMSFYAQLHNALQNSDLNTCQELYQKSVVSRLEYLESHINSIKPLSLRLELLENLHSMLFLSEYDLFNLMLNLNYQSQSYRPGWPLPETIIVNSTSTQDKEEEISQNLDKNRSVCSLFLLIDVLGILDRNLKLITSTTDEMSKATTSSIKMIDEKMAKTIVYPSHDEIEARIRDLNNVITDLRWRTGILTVNVFDTSFESVGILDFPIGISFDTSNRNLSDVYRTKPNKKIRSKSIVTSRKIRKISKERVSSFGEDRDNSHPEISAKILQLGISQSAGSLTRIISNYQMKDKFMLFEATLSSETLPVRFFSPDEVEHNLPSNNESPKLPKISKGNCSFLMNCLPHLLEPIEQLTVTILNCGYRSKAEEIYNRFRHVKNNTANFDELLSEIKYRDHFDELTSQLSEIATSNETTDNVTETDNQDSVPFGQFNWSKISALKDKLSSKNENAFGEIFNQLLSLDYGNRPTLKLDQYSEKQCKEIVLNEIKHFNCGLFFDIAISGSVTRWQLCQSIALIQSRFLAADSSTANNGTVKSMDSTKYYKMQTPLHVIKQLSNALSVDLGNRYNNYLELEMNLSGDIDYSLLMDQWLEQLQSSIHSLQFNESVGLEIGTTIGPIKSRWTYLNELITFLKDTCVGVAIKELPFRYLDRSMSLYLDSLSSHLRIFVSFLDKYKKDPEKSKTLNQSSNVQLQHEFSVLRRSPLHALGELIFLKAENPYSNEMLQISDDLGLNISAVVLENCIPSIDSGGVTSSPEVEDVLFDRPQRYNSTSDPSTDTESYNLDPIDTVAGCLNKIIKIFLKNSFTINQTDSSMELEDQEQPLSSINQPSNVVGSFSLSSQASTDNSSTESSHKTKEMLSTRQGKEASSSIMLSSGSRVFMSLCQDEDWQDLLVSDIVDLENVNLDMLKTNHDKVAFFIDLFNIMTIHMAVLAVENGKTTLKYRSLESKLMRSNFCYKVGQIGIVSIEQISQYYLNIPDVTFTDLNPNITELNSSPPTPIEKMYRSNCITCQNMAIFGMIDGTVSGQPLKVYYPDTIHKDLESNLSYTVKYKTTYETEKRQIFLPQIFKWYGKLVCSDNSEQRFRIGSDNSRPSPPSNIDELLISKILAKCNEKVARKFSVLLRLDTDTMIHNIKEQSSNKILKIIWQPRSENIGCSFIEKRHDLLSNTPRLTEFSSPGQSISVSQGALNYLSHFPLPNYQPTMEAINHLRDRSPLLACLAYMIIGDDFVSIPSSMADGALTSSQQPSRSSMHIEDQLTEIRSYKYSRIANEYPSIGNWIMTFWSLWNISQKSDISSAPNACPPPNLLASYCRSSIPIEIRWATFTHPLTKNFDQILIDYSVNVMNRDQYGYLNIGAALRMLQLQTMANSYKLQRLLDIMLQKSARYWANGLIIHTNNRNHSPPDNTHSDNESFRMQENRLLDCIYAMHNDDLRLSESIRYLDLFNIDNALKLMEYNYSIRSNNANEELKRQITVLRIFKRIHDLVITCQNKYEIWLKAHIPTEFLDWHRLHTFSETDPALVLKFMIKQKQFDLAKWWSQFYMPEDGEQKIDAEYLVSLVTDGNDRDKIVELVSHISKLHREEKAEKFMRVIHHVIGHSEAPFAIILICAYAIKYNIFDEFESADDVPSCEWRDRIHRAWVGASMLRSMANELIREQYSQLVEYPHLIIEQLIMNAEIEVFRKMMDLYKEQKKTYVAISRTKTGNKLSRMTSSETATYEGFISELTPERINALLTEYICKALELAAVRGDEEIDVDDVSISSRMMNSRLSFTSIRPDFINSSDSGGTVVNTEMGLNNASDTTSITDTFAMPTMPPPPDKWYKDSDASKCMCCSKEKFSMFNRRHHCRRCGRVICAQCSTHRMSIDGVTARICDDCNRYIKNQQNSDNRARRGSILLDNHRVGSVADMLYCRHNIPQRSESMASIPIFESQDTPPVSGFQTGVGALENGWRLGTNKTENERIRQMFNYDDAPSVTIAFSLADFHSNSNACGNLLLDRVEYLADFLKPMKNHLPNPEVDYLLVLDMAKQIAYKAKLKFSRLNNDLDFDRAENYLSRLDLLSVLVRSNFGNYLPSLSDGSKFIERIQSLRDKLIKEERLELAGIVSNKAGLSSDPVFVAMGLHALDEGRYDDARKLFSSCSKIGRYGSKPTTTLPYPVNEIMKILDGNKLSVELTKEMVDSSVDSEDLIKAPDLKFREDRDLSRKEIEEAIYYLDIYNAHLHCLQFLSRRDMWSKAIDYALKKNVSREVFIDGLIAPAVNRGHFASVKSEILMKEGLSSWKCYYEPLCKFLDKKSLYNDLLEFQENTGDHLQAARTLINYFYIRGSQNYAILREKLVYLEKAQRHLEMYINKKERNANFDLEKLMKHLILVKKQIEATLFLTDPITVSHHQARLGYVINSTNPPTLFGTPDALIDFCLMILFCRPNLSDGLQMLCPLMAQCHIYPEKILPKAAVWLLQHPLSIQSATPESDLAGVMLVFDLCTNIGPCYRLESRKYDDVLLAILPVIPLSLLTKSNMLNKFIGLFQSETKRIDALIVVKELRRAFSVAARFCYANEVQRILDLALSSNDLSGVIDMCKQWLSQNRASISKIVN